QTLQAAAEALSGPDRIEVQLALARLQREQGHPDSGRAILESLCDAYPQDAYFRVELLQFPSVRADVEQAEAVLAQLRAIEGNQGVHWRLERARLSMEAPDWQAQSGQTRQLLSECIQTDPTWAAPVLLLGELHERLGEASEAESLYRRAVDMTSANVDVVARLVHLLQQQQRYTEAEAALRRLPADLRMFDDQRLAVTVGLGAYEAAIREVQRRIEREPEHAPNYAFQARLVYAVRGDVDEALRLLDRAETLDPNLFAAVRSRAQILFAAGRVDEVRALLDQQVDKRNDFAAYELRAGFRVARGDHEAAESDYRTLCDLPGTQAAGYAALGRFHASLGRHDQAVAAWRAGLRQAPQDAGLRKLLIQALLFDPDASARAEGAALLAEGLAQAPDDVDLLMFRAELLAGEGTDEAIEEAEDLYQRILTKDAYHVGAHLAMIELARQRGDFPEARERFTRALGARPRSTELIVAGAWIEADSGNLPTARDMVGPVLRLDPQNVAALTLMARLALTEGDLDQSEEFNQRALALAPAHDPSRQIEAQLLVARGKLPEAIEKLETIRQTQPAACGPGTLVMLADLYRLLGDAAKAESALREAEQRAPEQASVFLAWQRLFASMGRFDEVLDGIKRRETHRPGDVGVLAEAAVMLAASRDDRHVNAAVDLLKDLAARVPDQATVFRALGLTMRQTGDFTAAEEAFRQVLRLEPYHRQTLNDLAWLLGVDRGEVEEGLELAERGLARYPADPHLLDTRGVLLLRSGRAADARQALETSARTAGAPAQTQARVRLHLAQACLELADPVAARLWLAEARAIDEREDVLTPQERQEMTRLTEDVSDPGGTMDADALRPTND
ncbi:MAG: tetratricopeptide repeat protein, partial [Phycisphaerae bacterium]|nr:tetratricopeptide repeat protein [Phycisphaerae bacterium]